MPLKNKNMLGLTPAKFVDTELNHAIMVYSKLRLLSYLKSRTNEDRETYKKQRTLCVNLQRHKGRSYFEAFDLRL